MHRVSIFKKAFCNDVIRGNVANVKVILRLFQENKSYGLKTICIHPLMSRRCTSHHHVWHSEYVRMYVRRCACVWGGVRGCVYLYIYVHKCWTATLSSIWSVRYRNEKKLATWNLVRYWT